MNRSCRVVNRPVYCDQHLALEWYEQAEGPIHGGVVTFENLRVQRPSPSGKEQSVTDIDLTVQQCVLKFEPSRLVCKQA